MSQFTKEEWGKISAELEKNPDKYGFPERRYGSVLLGSFNIKKLGSTRNRSPETWDFLAKVCKQFDLLSVQEIMDNLGGLNRIMEKLGPEFGMIVSDKTGAFPGERGVSERLAFIFRWSVVKRANVVSDISYDRTKVLNTLYEKIKPINEAISTYSKKLDELKNGERKTKPYLKMPVFLSFIRQPYCVSFKIVGHPETKPYEFMAVNAHLLYGDCHSDRKLEFEALMEWIIERMKEGKAYYPNFILLGDLNLKYDVPEKDRPRIEKYMKKFNNKLGKEVNVNFPFLYLHQNKNEVFKTNAREDETFDQIGLFFRDKRFPKVYDNHRMSDEGLGPNYGVFNFVELFKDALGVNYSTDDEKKSFLARFEHKVSDHKPIWLRLPLPD